MSDQAARTAILELHEVNLLVEAGAGAGKTGSIARRIAGLVARGICRIDEVAAITFTRKAAAELRGRCRLEIERQVATAADEITRARLAQALADMERMFAGTIHAFCAHLLRERPVEAGVAPRFVELDELQGKLRRRRDWRDYLERSAGSPLMRELEGTEIRVRDLDGAFDILCQYPDVEFPPGDALEPDPVGFWTAVDQFWARLGALLPATIASDTSCSIQKQVREFGPALNSADRARTAVLARLLSGWDKNFRATQNRWPSRNAALQADALVQEFKHETVEPFLAAWRQYLYRLVVTLGLEARELAAEARRRAAELNYEDLLQLTAKVLRTKRDVRQALQSKYPRLFVDEFQDTDPIQTEIVFLLASEPDSEPEWEAAPLRPGALFLVGDPKQSIFRFRRADIDIYERAKKRICASGGQVLPLTTCFRAVPALADWNNSAFSTLFPAQASPEQPAYRELDGVNDPDGARCGVFQLRLPATLQRKEVPAADARAISAYIRSEVGSGRRSWGDFLVITRKKGHLALYAAELERAHVPFEVSGSEAFANSPTVEVLGSLLYALSNPDDAPALVGVLRDELFGLDDEELFEFHRQGGRLLLHAPLPPDAGGPVAEAICTLQDMYGWTRLLPAAAAVDRILERTGLLAKASAESAAGGEAGKLLFALDCIRAAAAESGASLAEAVDELEARLGAGEADPPALEPGRQDVVRVMNLHKAKGLEAKVVFLADPLAGVRPRADVRIVREGNRATGYFQLTRDRGEFQTEVVAEPQGWAAHEAAELGYLNAEELRLLYVACTRPLHMLVVSRWDQADNRSVRPWERLGPFLATAPAVTIPELEETEPAAAELEITVEGRRAAAEVRDEVLRGLLRPTWSVTAVTESAPGARREPHPESEAYGPAWGRLVHALLDYACLHPGCAREDLERRAGWQAMDDAACAPLGAVAVEAVTQVMASTFWAHVRAAAERLTEVPVFAELPDEEGPRRFQTGVIDLALRLPEGWEIIDYKTEAGDPVRLAQRYGEQVRAYAAHWEKITRERVTFAGIYSVRNNSLSADVRAGTVVPDTA
ncbi:MAG: UvrD-helicase domain-containing protein [Bryobacterales bacterium]|nr:UvrD-helicase domain-containing protein [Bryobacterales bacterium]